MALREAFPASCAAYAALRSACIFMAFLDMVPGRQRIIPVEISTTLVLVVSASAIAEVKELNFFPLASYILSSFCLAVVRPGDEVKDTA